MRVKVKILAWYFFEGNPWAGVYLDGGNLCIEIHMDVGCAGADIEKGRTRKRENQLKKKQQKKNRKRKNQKETFR